MPSRTVPVLLGTTLAYRVATGMGPLAILITVGLHESLGVASFALTVWTLGGAVTQPLWVALTARWGYRRTLLLLGVLSGAGHVAVAVARGAVPCVVAAGLAGLFLPPVTALIRARLADLLVGERRERAFHRESALAGLAFVVAPAVVGGAGALAPAGPMVAAAALHVVVSLVCARLGGPGKRDRANAEQSETPRTAAANKVAGAVVILVVAGAAAYGMLACVEIGVVDRFRTPSASAWVLALWSLASVVGGWLLARIRTGHRSRVAILAVAPIAYALLALVGGDLWFGAVLVLSGLTVAPTLAFLTSRLADVAAPAVRTRAYAWLQSSSWIGASAATAAASVLVVTAPGGVMLLAAALGAVVVPAVALPARRR